MAIGQLFIGKTNKIETRKGVKSLLLQVKF